MKYTGRLTVVLGLTLYLARWDPSHCFMLMRPR
jgi:hypothetical protein